jgi:hypothetical protein
MILEIKPRLPIDVEVLRCGFPTNMDELPTDPQEDP